ncbi:MAG TPA: hypothetical protein VEB86_06400 [Chryseosolibacter sp.]|nr:hypothetical protein [Chryseosolibacter sp.]
MMILFSVSDLAAQVMQTRRFEQVQKGGDEYYSVVSLKEDGLALVRERDKYSGSKRHWELLLLDTALQEKKRIEFHLDERFPMIGYEVAPNSLYLLFRTGETNKNSLQLLEFSTVDGVEMSRFEIKPEVEFKITHFSKVGNSIVFGGYVSNDPAVLLFDLGNKSLKVVPGFFQKDTELVDLRVNQNQTFNVVLIDRTQRSDRKFVFRTFDESGKLLLEDLVPIDDDRSLQASISSTLEREDLMVLGTWGDRVGKQSAGFFSLPVDPFGEQKIKYYHFGEMEHFLDFLNEKRAQRIKNNTRADIKSGRKPSYTSYVFPYRVLENKDGYFLLAEIYNPVTTSNPYYNNPYPAYYPNPAFYYPYWSPYYPGMRYRPSSYGNNVKNTEEIKTYATVLVSFNAHGELQWDQSIKLEEIERPGLEQVADFYYTPSEVYFMYKKESELRIKIIPKDADPSDEVQKIKLTDPMDELRDEKKHEGGIKHWVDNTFYVWGYQTIRNQQRRDDRVRDVFYINKVVVR